MNAFEGTLFTRLNDSCCTDKDGKQTQSPSTDLNQWGAGWQVFVFSVLRYLFVYRCKCAFQINLPSLDSSPTHFCF